MAHPNEDDRWDVPDDGKDEEEEEVQHYLRLEREHKADLRDDAAMIEFLGVWDPRDNDRGYNRHVEQKINKTIATLRDRIENEADILTMLSDAIEYKEARGPRMEGRYGYDRFAFQEFKDDVDDLELCFMEASDRYEALAREMLRMNNLARIHANRHSRMARTYHWQEQGHRMNRHMNQRVRRWWGRHGW